MNENTLRKAWEEVGFSIAPKNSFVVEFFDDEVKYVAPLPIAPAGT